jgi:hypothetical protein
VYFFGLPTTTTNASVAATTTSTSTSTPHSYVKKACNFGESLTISFYLVTQMTNN